MDTLITFSAIVAIYIFCRIAPLIVAIPIGVGARIFKYEIFPGSLTASWIFIFAGILGAMSADLTYRVFGFSLHWWPFAVTFVIFAAMCSQKKLDINGLSYTAGSAIGILLYLPIRWLAQ